MEVGIYGNGQLKRETNQKGHRSMRGSATISFARKIKHRLNHYRNRSFINSLVYSQRR